MTKIDDKSLDINQHGVLKISIELWFMLIFLVRHWIFMLFAAASAFANQIDSMRLFGSDFPWITLVIEIPAALALWLCMQRTPNAGVVIRKLWPFVRPLAGTTAVCHMFYLVWYLKQSSYWLPWPELFLASTTLIDFAIIYGLYSSPHLQMVLNEFPHSKIP